MAGKLTPARRIDAKAALDGGETFDVSAEDFAPPAGRTIEGPENLALDSALVRSAITPEANVSATWEVLVGVVPDQFIVQISTDPAFPDDNTRTLYTPGDQPSITIAALKTGTAYSVRVAMVRQAAQSVWSATVAETTPNDTIAPGPVASAAYDFTGRDCLLSWTNPTSDNFRHVRVDIYASNGGTHLHTFYTAAGHYTYLGDQNLVDTSAVGDPSLYMVLTAVSWFGVDSTPVNLSPTNAAPSAPTVNAAVGFTQILATVTSTPPLDLDVYEFVWKNGAGSTVRTAYTQAATDLYQATTTDTYSVVVRVRDIFGQYSSTTTVGTLTVDALTITDLRSDSSYSDSIGTDFSTAPNKTVLKDDTTGAGISYASSASAWRWTKVAYPLTDRFRRISLSLGSGSANFYVGLSSDDVTYTWYSGALTGIVLTLVASEAAAQAAAPLFSALTGGYAELPATVEARYIKIGHRNTTTGYRIDEAYGQRLVIADVIKVGQLSAITADMGSITAGTITGATVQTAASGQRVVLNTAGIASYDTGGSQVAGISSADGSVSIIAPATAGSWIRSYGFTYGGATLGGVQGYSSASAGSIVLQCEQRASYDSQATVAAISDTNRLSIVGLLAYNAVGLATQASITGYSRYNDGSPHDSNINLYADTVTMNGAGTSVLTYAAGLLTFSRNTAASDVTILIQNVTAGRSASLDWKGTAQQWRAGLDGANSDRWALYDVTNNRTPLIVEAGAANNSLKINSAGALVLGSMTAGSVLFSGASGVVSQDNTNFWWNDTDNVLHLGGTSSITGTPRLALKGTDSNAATGPHMTASTAADAYPLIQHLNYAHDIIYISFDAYFDGTNWKSSDAGSNFQIRKQSDAIGLWFESGIAQGSNITWDSGLIVSAAGEVTINQGLNIGNATGATQGQMLGMLTDSGTTNSPILSVLTHNSSGTPTTNFGLAQQWNLKTSTTPDRNAAQRNVQWSTATEGSQKALVRDFAYDTAAREYLRGEASGTAAKIGLLGAAAVVRQTVAAAAAAGGTGATAGAYDTAAHRDALITLVNDMRSAGIALGLWS